MSPPERGGGPAGAAASSSTGASPSTPASSTRASSSTGAPVGAGPARLVRAAGAVCWTRTTASPASLRVLLVHRPQYDDWSWPKGKLEGGEGDVEAAVREVAEETGLAVRLGRDLPPARYPLDDRTSKHVAYWAAQVPHPGQHPEGAPGEPAEPTAPRPDEVDRLAWLTTGEAERRLSRRGDRAQLRALVDADAEGALETWPLVVLRHGHASPKPAWRGPDAERPLTSEGVEQAEALVALLRAWSPDRVVTSPWDRCLQTVQPYLAAHPAPLRARGRLSEDGHRRDPAKVARLVAKLLLRGRPTLLCTHRPVLSTVLGTVAGSASIGVGDAIPRLDPYLRPGEALVAHVSARTGRVVRVERHLPGDVSDGA